jgi:molybdopterin molybdotransferase
MTPLLPVDNAIARIIADIRPLGTEWVPLRDANRRVLAEPLAARITQPPFPASAMDGYAVRAEDVELAGRSLRLIGIAAAGHSFAGKVGPGETVRIFTGAPLPEGADAVLIQENAEVIDPATVRARESVAAGRNVRPAGLDFTAGAVLLPAGRRIGMREAALAAAMGLALLPVRRRPRVAVIATGDELVAPGAPRGPQQIFASNPSGIAAYVETLGGEAHDLGIIRDDLAALRQGVDAARTIPADVLVTLGGASVGEHDLIRQALEAAGMALDFWRIAMRPGKPLLFGRLAGTRVLGLPGNPVSSLVCSILFLEPLIAALLGAQSEAQLMPAVLGSDLPPNDARQDYLRAVLRRSHGEPPVATALPIQDSSMLSVLAVADCLILRPPHAAGASTGDFCKILMLP